MKRIKQYDEFLARDLAHGSFVIVQACEDSKPKAQWIACDQGTFSLKTMRHVSRPLLLVGRLVPL